MHYMRLLFINDVLSKSKSNYNGSDNILILKISTSNAALQQLDYAMRQVSRGMISSSGHAASTARIRWFVVLWAACAA
jgi:hypothetical protein